MSLLNNSRFHIIKKIIFTIIFIVLLCFCYNILEKILGVKSNFNKSFYNEDKYDIVFFGSSTTYWPISPMYIWEKYGVTSYNRSFTAQHYDVSKLLIEEVLRKKRTKIIVLDILSVLKAKYVPDIYHTKLILSSLNGIINRYYSYSLFYDKALFDDDFIKWFGQYNTLSQYHIRWKNLSLFDFSFHNKSLKGEVLSFYNTWNYNIYAKPIFDYNRDTFLKEEVTNFIENLVATTKQYGVDIFFILSPYYSDDKIKTFERIAKERKWDFINYNSEYMYELLDLNDYKDNFDAFHLTKSGGNKLLDHLIPYIIEKYSLKSHKNDKKYVEWEKDYIEFLKENNRAKIREFNDFESFFENINFKFDNITSNYILFLSLKGSDVSKLSKKSLEKLSSLGLQKIYFLEEGDNYLAIIDNNSVVYEEMSIDNLVYNKRYNKLVKIVMTSSLHNASINISGKEYSKQIEGMNIVVYDKEKRQVIDSVGIDVLEPYGIKRDKNENVIEKLRVSLLYNDILLEKGKIIIGDLTLDYNSENDLIALLLDDDFMVRGIKYNLYHPIGSNQLIIEKDNKSDSVKLFVGDNKYNGSIKLDNFLDIS